MKIKHWENTILNKISITSLQNNIIFFKISISYYFMTHPIT